jgi:hypothetical protein
MDHAADNAVVRIDYNLFAISDSGLPVTPSPRELAASSGLICTLDAGAVIATGIDMGYVRVKVRALDTEPPLETESEWDEVVDASVSAPGGDLRVEAILGDAPSLPTLTPPGPGTYRMRVCARGRRNSPKEVADEVAESYLLEVWPAPSSPEVVHRLQMNRFSV